MQLHHIFIGLPKETEYNGRLVMTGIYKEEVAHPVTVKYLNIEGDKQADLKVHGGVEKAVYAYPMEHYAFWAAQRPDLEFAPGRFGENLSVSGLTEQTVHIGDEFRIGTVALRVTSPRMPCFKLGIKMGDPKFIGEFLEAQRTGFYFKVLEEGTFQPGDAIEKIGDDDYELTVEEVVRLYNADKHNTTLLKKAIQSPSLPFDWVTFFQRRLERLVS